MNKQIILNLKKEYNVLKDDYHTNSSDTKIYKALEKNTQRTVIIKCINYENEESKKYIETEIQCMINAEKFCAFIPTIYDYSINRQDKLITIVMKNIEGELLRDMMNKQKNNLKLQNTIDNNIRLMKQICSVIGEIHKVPYLIHRDLKPENIIIKNPFSRNQEVYIIDFGISGILEYKGIGTEDYMAPEQKRDFRGIYISQSTDIFSLGLIMFELFSGKLPKIHEDLIYTIGDNDWEGIPSLRLFNDSLTEEMDSIINRALAYNPGKRYRNGVDMAAALSRIGSRKRRN